MMVGDRRISPMSSSPFRQDGRKLVLESARSSERGAYFSLVERVATSARSQRLERFHTQHPKIVFRFDRAFPIRERRSKSICKKRSATRHSVTINATRTSQGDRVRVATHFRLGGPVTTLVTRSSSFIGGWNDWFSDLVPHAREEDLANTSQPGSLQRWPEHH